MSYFRITLLRSAIGLPAKRRGVLEALGLKRRLAVVYHPVSQDIAGMIMAVKELVDVREVADYKSKTQIREERRPESGFWVESRARHASRNLVRHLDGQRSHDNLLPRQLLISRHSLLSFKTTTEMWPSIFQTTQRSSWLPFEMPIGNPFKALGSFSSNAPKGLNLKLPGWLSLKRPYSLPPGFDFPVGQQTYPCTVKIVPYVPTSPTAWFAHGVRVLYPSFFSGISDSLERIGNTSWQYFNIMPPPLQWLIRAICIASACYFFGRVSMKLMWPIYDFLGLVPKDLARFQHHLETHTKIQLRDEEEKMSMAEFLRRETVNIRLHKLLRSQDDGGFALWMVTLAHFMYCFHQSAYPDFVQAWFYAVTWTALAMVVWNTCFLLMATVMVPRAETATWFGDNVDLLHERDESGQRSVAAEEQEL